MSTSLEDKAQAAALIPIGIEFALASIFAMLLMAKRKTKGNFPIAIMYSATKLLAVCSFLALHLHLFGIPHVPFLVGLLINEIVLLVLSIRLRDVILVTPFSRLYSRRIKAVRFVGELSTAVVILGVVSFLPFAPCSCNKKKVLLAGIPQEYCDTSDVDTIIGALLRNQVKGLAFAISVTASVAAISSMRFMASSIGKEVTGKADRDVIQYMMMDSGWKQAIRTVYAVLGIFVNGVFVASFFYSGTNDCLIVGKDTFRYGLGPVPSSLLNAIMAISQVFMADMLLKISAKSAEMDQSSQQKFLSDSEESDGESIEAGPGSAAVKAPQVKYWISRSFCEEERLSQTNRPNNAGNDNPV